MARRTFAYVIVATLFAGCVAARSSAGPSVPTRIEDARFVSLGGIDQWITIRGDDAHRPILLLLHGGPGDVQSPYASVYAPYERHFVLVQWDQRGAGKTFAKYGEHTPELTLERVANDGIELAEYLHRRFPANRIFLLGHSWGSVIGTVMVRARPELFAAYVGTGQVASWAESAEAQFEFLKSRARETGNAPLVAQLDSIGRLDPTNATQYFAATRSLRNFLPDSDKAWLSRILRLLKDSSGMTNDELTALDGGMRFSGRTLLPTQLRERLSSDALRFELPYFVIQGQDDWFVPTAPARAYFDRVVAPRKRMVVLQGAGHFALVTHANAFIAALESMLEDR